MNYADRLTVIAAAALLGSACGGARPEPGPAGASTAGPAEAPAQSPAAAPAAAPNTIPYTPADVAFVQGMMVHHAQALEMTRLVPDRTNDRDLGLLARRISESQDYEIGLMSRWLTRRDEAAPSIDGSATQMAHGQGSGHEMADSADTSGMPGMTHMAGMATPEQMAGLSDSTDEAFERLFLELMIRHHEGALTMLGDLAKQEGAGQEPELFQLISHVDADQRAEIARMRRMLNELQ